MKIVVNSGELSRYLNIFLFHAKVGGTYDLVIKDGYLHIDGHITKEKVKIRPVTAEYSHGWTYTQFSRLGAIIAVIDKQDLTVNLDAMAVWVFL